MPTTHIIAFKLKEGTDLVAARALFEKAFDFKATVLQALTFHQDLCKKPDGALYVRGVRGGKQVTEGLLGQIAKGWEWAFVFEFANTDDLQYFLLKDPEHQKFAASFRPLLADATALTFDDKVF
ncbi:hypothetical protein HDZ31DRAFT_12117, partial [Schizophyllum fasciatum]